MSTDSIYMIVTFLTFLFVLWRFLSLVNTARTQHVTYLGSYYSVEGLLTNPTDQLLLLQACLLSYDMPALGVGTLELKEQLVVPVGEQNEAVLLHRGRDTIVAIRGSLWLGDLVTDLNLLSSDGLHSGFQKYMNHVYGLVVPLVEDHFFHRGLVPFYFTGHSLGGVIGEWIVSILLGLHPAWEGYLRSVGFGVPTYLKTVPPVTLASHSKACLSYLHTDDPLRHLPGFDYRLGKTIQWTNTSKLNSHLAVAYYDTILHMGVQ
jgi:hypothetical protein